MTGCLFDKAGILMVPPIPYAVYDLVHKYGIGNFCISRSIEDTKRVQHPIHYTTTLLPKTAPAILEDLTLDEMRKINIINLELF